MELSNLSKSVLHFGTHKIPAVGFGTYLLKGETGFAAIKHAIKTGYRLIDTAHLYQNEAIVGQARDACLKTSVIFKKNKVSKQLNSIYRKRFYLAALDFFFINGSDHYANSEKNIHFNLRFLKILYQWVPY